MRSALGPGLEMETAETQQREQGLETASPPVAGLEPPTVAVQPEPEVTCLNTHNQAYMIQWQAGYGHSDDPTGNTGLGQVQIGRR